MTTDSGTREVRGTHETPGAGAPSEAETGTEAGTGTGTEGGSGTGTGARAGGTGRYEPLPGPSSRKAPGRAGGPGRVLARAAALTAGFTAVGALLGLVRDQLLARSFGAGGETDAFLVAWTVPEFAATLLIEDAMALVLVPAFARALARRSAAPAAGPDPVRALVRATLPRAALVTAGAAGLLVLAAPRVVPLLAPGLPESALAVDCTRSTATCVFSFALAGYASAALRAHGRYAAPAAIYVAYNAGIIAAVLLLGPAWGVRAAAAGVALGGAAMVLLQAPVLWRRLRAVADAPGAGAPGPVADGGTAVRALLVVLAPAIVFALTRQSQVLVERFLAAPLPAGAISHLNYAQKVAQLPMVLSLMLCTVSFPVVARALAAGDTAGAGRRAERDLLAAAALVTLGAAAVIAGAPGIVELLFQRGAFDPADTGATATVMRVYALGLLGQTLVGGLVRCYFSAARPLWYPAAAMAAGVALTAVAGAYGARSWGAPGIAAANALGITLTATLLLCGARRQSVPLSVRRLAGGLARLMAAGAVATAAGWASATGPAPLAVPLALAVTTAVFLAAALLLRAPAVTELAAFVPGLGGLPVVRPRGGRPAPAATRSVLPKARR